MSQRQIASCVMFFLCVKIFFSAREFCRSNMAQKIKSDNFCDLLRRQNSVAETKIFTKILQYTRSDLSLRCVAATCYCNWSPDLFTRSDMSPQRVAATNRPTCTHGVICRLDLLLQLVARTVHTERYVASTCCCNMSPSVVY